MKRSAGTNLKDWGRTRRVWSTEGVGGVLEENEGV